jgi:periplasmic mercuric ion binding protein
MKSLRIFLFLAIVPLISISAARIPEPAEVVIRITSHCDHFEVCETGKTRLEKELAFTKGVKSFTVDSKTMQVTVKYNPKRTTPQQIREAIARAGYDADDVKADPKGVEKLDDCCRQKQ